MDNHEIVAATGKEKSRTELQMEAILALMELSLAPALALIPSRVKSDVEASFERFKELVNDGIE